MVSDGFGRNVSYCFNVSVVRVIVAIVLLRGACLDRIVAYLIVR